MARINPDELKKLHDDVRSHEHLRRLVRELERMHRLVFHSHAADGERVRRSAEQILIADIVMRHRGTIDGVYYAIRTAEAQGKTWDRALSDYAAAAHAYYTTPLGLLIRRDLFGEDAQFISPLADNLLAGVERSRPTKPQPPA